MDAPKTFFFFLEKSHIDWPIINFFLSLGTLPIGALLQTPQLQIETNVHL
jgi:hypothetical protein